MTRDITEDYKNIMFQDDLRNVNNTLREKIDELLVLKARLKNAMDSLDELKQKINVLESQDLPALLDEFGLEEFKFQDGVKVSLNDKSFTYVNVPEREKGWEKLKEKGYTGIIKPVVTITVSQAEDKQAIDDLLLLVNKSVKHEKIELNYEYSSARLSSAANEMELQGIELEADIFKRSAKRGIKITEPKVSKQ